MSEQAVQEIPVPVGAYLVAVGEQGGSPGRPLGWAWEWKAAEEMARHYGFEATIWQQEDGRWQEVPWVF